MGVRARVQRESPGWGHPSSSERQRHLTQWQQRRSPVLHIILHWLTKIRAVWLL